MPKKITHTRTRLQPPVDLLKEVDSLKLAHSVRFRTFGNGYPYAVAQAFGGDLVEAMRRTDRQVARRVVRWARRKGVLSGFRVAVRLAERKNGGQ
jgi:hypothetical protein